jgi:hypothetical protein
VLRSEPGQLEVSFVREILRLIVTLPRESTTTTTNNIQGNVGQITTIYNNIIQDIDSKNISEERKSRLRRLADFARTHYSFILPFLSEGLRRIPSSG